MKLKGYTLIESIRIWLAGALFIRGKLWEKIMNDKRFYDHIKSKHENL